jgi:hypothetical protein
MIFFELKGKVLAKITDKGPNILDFEDSCGTKYSLIHEQDCCENVDLYKTVGRFENIIGSPITLAEQDHSEPKFAPNSYSESHTWSNFYLETAKGRLEIYCLGESNGYYCESVHFVVEENKK